MKIKTAKILSVFFFLIFVIALPLVCTFIPYREPVLIEASFNIAPAEGTSVVVYGELYNPTIVTIEDLEIQINFYNENDEFITTKKVNVTLNVGAGQTKEFIETINVGTVLNEQCQYGVGDILYTYTQLSWYLYFCMGICAYFITFLLLGKQKYYFEVNGQKVEVFASSYKLALIVDGEKVAETTQRKGIMLDLEYKLGESEIKVESRNPIILPGPKVTIMVDGSKPTITDTKQHGFIKIESKKKENEVLQ